MVRVVLASMVWIASAANSTACNDPTNACTGVCAPCKGTCETLKSSFCAQCWAVDPKLGTSCLSDTAASDCRGCWHPTPGPSPPSPPSPPTPPAPPSGGMYTCQGTPYAGGTCVPDPKGYYSAAICSLACGPPAPGPPPAPSPPSPPSPGGCNDPTNACTGVCAPCKGTCETLKSSFCAQCWAVDPKLGTSCLSDTAGSDCRDCWHPKPTPPAPAPTPAPTPAPAPSPASSCPGGSLQACMGLCPTTPCVVFTACVANCGTKCGSPAPAPAPTPTPAPAPTPCPCDDPTGGCSAGGACDQCKLCEATKTGPCAACWAVDATVGKACLSDSTTDCRTCWCDKEIQFTPPAPAPTPCPCDDPTGGCSAGGACEECKLCEATKTGPCAACWAVDTTVGKACLSDSTTDCRTCWCDKEMFV